MDALTPINEGGLGGFVADDAGPTEQAVVSSTVALDEAYVQLQGLVMLGQLEKASALSEERDDLLGACILAEIKLIESDAKTARRVLQEALDEVDEDAPGYTAALFGMAKCTAQLGKHKKAKRILGELEDLDPGFRSGEVAALKRALSLLAGR